MWPEFPCLFYLGDTTLYHRLGGHSFLENLDVQKVKGGEAYASLQKEPPVRKPKKIAPDNVGLLCIIWETKRWVLRMGYGCNCKKIIGGV